MRTIARVDRNHAEIVAAMRKIGAHVVNTSQLKNAFDCIAFYAGKTFIIEIKDGTKTASKKKLTEGELKTKEAIENRGVKYHVIESINEAIDLLINTQK